MKRTIKTSLVMLAAAAAVAAGIIAVPALNVKAADIEINETTFPDEYFRNWILSQSYGLDKKLTPEEIADVKKIQIPSTVDAGKITDIKGIEYFTEITYLSTNGKLTSLDVSKNTKLTKLYCDGAQLTRLDLSYNPDLIELDCCGNQLTGLDLKNNTKLKILFCWSNQLTSIDVSRCAQLSNFQCYSNQLTQINVGNNTSLRFFDCHNNPISKLDVSNISGLETLRCYRTNITKLIVANNKALKDLQCGNTQLKTLELDNNTALEILKIDETPMTAIDLSKNTNLKTLSFKKSLFTSLNLSNNTAIEYIYGDSSSKLQKIDLGNNTALRCLYCSNCDLAGLDVSKCTSLKDLFCDNNRISKIDVSGCTMLERLLISANSIKDIDISKNTLLKVLYVQGNQLESLDISKLPLLETLYCSGNKITSLDLDNKPELIFLDCRNNKLDFLDVSMNEKLATLYCDNNPMDKVYIHQGSIYCSSGSIIKVVLTPSDWKYTGVEWKINENNPSKSKATAKFQCTKEGEEDYALSKEMKVTYTLTNASCDKAGKKEYVAKLSEEVSRTKKAITEKKTISIPKLAHNWSSWKSTKKASVGTAAVDSRSCSLCKSKETRNPEAILICGKKLSLPDTLKGMSSVTWKSSDTKIATVDSKGKITAKMAGKVTISATASGKTEKCVVTVLYKDVINSSDFWFAPTNYLTAKGVVKGYANQTEFRPANECTRAQMVTFLYRLQGEPKTKSNKCKFDDVKSGDYFYKPVIWAVEQGITTGVSENKFAPQKVCTRAQTVTFLWRMAGKPEPGKNAKTFSDVNKKDYFYKATLWASDKKILAGYDDGTFRPQGKCLRRQMVTFLYKYDKFVNNR